ncbi:MAG TPA: DUF1552 domain-containing protein [Polyangiaceae bacterium]|nr:DUF1552 domain-containing protein [Polyangiaceae bacterium]
MTKPFRLSRRAVLRGAGSVAIALPWLEAMQPLPSAQAAAAPARRFVAVYTPGGTVLDAWTPSSITELSPILAPLSSVRERLVVLKGLALKCAVGEQLQAGMIAWLTGCRQTRNGVAIPNASIDQVLAQASGKPALYQAVRWGTRPSDAGKPSAHNTVSYGASDADFRFVQPELDPAATWERLFGKLPAGSDTAWKQSILDGVMARYAKLSAKLGGADRQRLEKHLELVRSLEQNLQSHCSPPEAPDVSDYVPGVVEDPATDAAIPVVGKLMMDMLVMALACELTNVATLQWADAWAAYTLPWLELPGGRVQNYYENNGGYDVASMTKIFTWYSTQHAYLLSQMANVDLGGHSLLDESVVFFGSQQQSPATHAKTDMPFLLAGGGGGLKQGRVLDFAGQSHNDLLVSLLNLCGDPRTVFGDAEYCSGPLAGL